MYSAVQDTEWIISNKNVDIKFSVHDAFPE